MTDIILEISGTVIVLNIILTVIPDGKYERYVSLAAGLIIMAVMIGNFKPVDIIPDFSTGIFDTDYQNEIVSREIIEKTATVMEKKFQSTYPDFVKEAHIDFDGKINGVRITLFDISAKDYVENKAAEYFGIPENLITAE